jgi:hypothetical protein
MIDLSAVKQIYNSVIDDLLSANGLTVPCSFFFQDGTKTQCPNCEFNPITGRSNNSYNGTGDIAFPNGQICPICNGEGAIDNTESKEINLIAIFDYKKFINFGNVNVPVGSMQTISKISNFIDVRNANYIIVDTNITNYAQNKFTRITEPQPVGLGDHQYVFTNWERSA